MGVRESEGIQGEKPFITLFMDSNQSGSKPRIIDGRCSGRDGLTNDLRTLFYEEGGGGGGGGERSGRTWM